MGENKKLRRHRATLVRRFDEHRDKVEEEESKSAPDFGLIKHWQKEMRAFQDRISEIERKLKKH